MEFDCKSPADVAQNLTERICVAKTQLEPFKLLVLGILAGVYIGFGCELSTLVGHDAAKFVGVGLASFMRGAVFSVGLMLVVIAGAELFTGNSLVVLSVLDRKISVRGLLYNWSLAYGANLVGSVLLAWIMFGSGLLEGRNAAIGASALGIAAAKSNLAFWPAFFRGILCNWLVCLAIWMAVASRDIIGKIFAVFFPIMAFVASGFEHSVANMYFIPVGMMLKRIPEVFSTAVSMGVSPEAMGKLNLYGFLVRNEIPVTLGNIVGGAFFVATLYWAVYRRRSVRGKTFS